MGWARQMSDRPGPPKTFYVLIYAINLQQIGIIRIYIANNKPPESFNTFDRFYQAKQLYCCGLWDRNSILLSVCLFVTRVLCDQTINVQRYSQNHGQNWIFGQHYGAIMAIYALYLKFLTQRNLVA